MPRPLTLDDVARYPRPGMVVPAALAFSPDDALVTFLASPDGTLRQVLCSLDAATGQRRVLFDAAAGGVTDATVSREEALRRERLRERGLGVTAYAWADTGRRLLVPVGGKLRVLDLDANRETTIPVAEGAPPVDARFSPCGKFVAYVQDAELHVAECFGGAPLQVTSGARGTGRTNGLAEYVAQEEMARHAGWWWSPDSSRLAFEEVDETHIPRARTRWASRRRRTTAIRSRARRTRRCGSASSPRRAARRCGWTSATPSTSRASRGSPTARSRRSS
jgi:dipeptidyl-peptidase-4